jgi:hypothetical protein
MKRLLLSLVFLLIFSSLAYPAWKMNPFTGKLDYYETGTGAPTDADYLVGTANANLSAEIVVGITPAGELGGTWASPTIDDNLSVSSWTLVSPIITTSFTATGLVKDADITSTEDVMKAQIHFDIDGGGSVITAGAKAWVRVPFNMTITGWDITANETGSIVLDVWKDTYINFPLTVLDTIAGTEKPTLATVQKNQDISLTSWTTTVTAGDYIRINVDSVTTCTKVAVDIYGNKT